MKLGISTHILALWPLEKDHLALIRRAGFEGLELWAMSPHIDIETPGSVALAGRWAAEMGLAVHSVHLPFYRRAGAPDFRYLNLGDPDPEARSLAKRLAKLVLPEVRDAGADIAVIHGITDWEDPPRDLMRPYLDDLAEVAQIARAHGVTLAIENIMTTLSTSDHVAGIIDRLGLSEVRACLDTGHANINENPVEAVRRLGARLITTHVQDNHGTDDEHLIPGKGSIDWPAVVAALRESADPNFILEIMWPMGGSTVEENAFFEYLCEARIAAEELLAVNRGARAPSFVTKM